MSDETKQFIVESLTNEQLADYIDPMAANLVKNPGGDLTSIIMRDYFLIEIAKRLRNHPLEQ